MKWSLRLGRFLGIDVFLHFTFLLFLAWIWFSTRAQGLGSVAFFLAAFFCVLLHEYGHALTARRYGIATRDITLLPIGGVARLERMPAEPRQELIVAVAGPAVNVVIAAILTAICFAMGINPMPSSAAELATGRAPLLVILIGWNITMVLFNMLPAFPMDGGRVLRALLAMKLNYAKATRWAANTGKAMALVFAWVAIFHIGHPLLILVAFFVWIGAGDEAAAAEQKVMLTGVQVRDAMIVDFRRVSPEEPAGTLAQLILQGWQTDFPVVFDGKVIGIVSWRDVITGLAAGRSAPVSSFMRREVPDCRPSDDLEECLNRMRELDLALLPVVEGDRLLGLVTPGNIGEFMLIRRALEAK